MFNFGCPSYGVGIEDCQVNLFHLQISRFTTKAVKIPFGRFFDFPATMRLRGKIAHVMAEIARLPLRTAAISRNVMACTDPFRQDILVDI